MEGIDWIYLFSENEMDLYECESFEPIENEQLSVFNDNDSNIENKDAVGQSSMNETNNSTLTPKDELIPYVINSYMFHQYKNKDSMLNKHFLNNLLEFVQINYAQLISLQSKFVSKKLKMKNGKFSDEEDDMIKKIVFAFGPKNWRLIATLIPGRTSRQCRDRYANYLAPGFIHSNWSNEEDRLLAEKYNMFGPKWTQIQKFFPYRTANDIKNRYKYTISHIYYDKINDFQPKNDSVEINHILIKDQNKEQKTNENAQIFNFGNESFDFFNQEF